MRSQQSFHGRKLGFKVWKWQIQNLNILDNNYIYLWSSNKKIFAKNSFKLLFFSQKMCLKLKLNNIK